MAYYGKRIWLTKLRKQAGYTQSLLSAMADLTYCYINRYENGETNISEEAEKRVANALGITLEDIHRNDAEMRQGNGK